jgi:hypothetical protein
VSIARTAAPAPSEAVLYRKIERDHPTLPLDEVDTVWRGGGGCNDNHDGLRALLKAGNESGVRVPRCAGPRGEQLVDFDVYCPKVLAGIGQLPETVADRSILVAMKRRTKRERVERFRAAASWAGWVPGRPAGRSREGAWLTRFSGEVRVLPGPFQHQQPCGNRMKPWAGGSRGPGRALALVHRLVVVAARARYQYVSTGRTSTAPPRRAAGMREATSIAASRSSASRT